MKAKEMREKTGEDLNNLLSDWRRELFDIRVRSMTGQMEKATRTRQLKKDIARALTVLRDSSGTGPAAGEETDIP